MGFGSRGSIFVGRRKGRVGGTTVPNGALACMLYTVGGGFQVPTSKLGPFVNFIFWEKLIVPATHNRVTYKECFYGGHLDATWHTM